MFRDDLIKFAVTFILLFVAAELVVLSLMPWKLPPPHEAQADFAIESLHQ